MIANSNIYLRKKHFDALKCLKEDQNILVNRLDTGSGIVLMNKSDYIDKMESLLDDRTKFTRTLKDKDLTNAIEKCISNHLRYLKEKEVIVLVPFEKVRSTGTTMPRLYRLPKIYKDGLPLGPVLDMSSSPYHALAKWLAKQREPVRKRLAIYSLRDIFIKRDATRLKRCLRWELFCKHDDI